MIPAVLDRTELQNLHKAIDELPAYRLSEDEDDEPLSESEIAQIEAARAEVAAGHFYTLDEFNRRMAVL